MSGRRDLAVVALFREYQRLQPYVMKGKPVLSSRAALEILALPVTERLRSSAELLVAGPKLATRAARIALLEDIVARIDSAREELAGALEYLREREGKS